MRWLLAVALVLSSGAGLLAQSKSSPPARGGSTPAVNGSASPVMMTPYQITIVIHVVPHPLLTPLFVTAVKNEVRDAIQRDLGPTGVVQVVEEHPFMQEVETGGWKALDTLTDITDSKTHLIRIGYNDGEYEIQARQVDGYTGLVSPLRRAATGDRLWVARQAALLVAQDFGVVGEITEFVEKTAAVTLKAANLGTAESIRVQSGEVFAISHLVRGQDGKLRGQLVQEAVLFVTGIREGGACTTRVFNRLQNLKAGRDTVGFRAIKLGTRYAQLQLKLVDTKTGAPVAGAEVQLIPGADENLTPIKLGATDTTGRIRSNQVFHHVAFVRILRDGQTRAAAAVPLLDDQPIEFRISGTQSAEAFAEFEYYFRQWKRPMGETMATLEVKFEEFRADLGAQKPEEALKKAEEMVEWLNKETQELTEQFEKVKEVVKAAKTDADKTVERQIDNMVKEGEGNLKYLDDAAKNIGKWIADAKNPSPATQKFNEGKIALDNGKIDEAIKLFRQSVELDKSNAGRKRVYDKLNRAWTIKNPAHREARNLITQQWAKITDYQKLNDEFGAVEKTLKVLEEAGDFLTAQLLLKANSDHITNLNKIAGQLSPQTNQDDAEKYEAIASVANSLRLLNEAVLEFIAKFDDN